MLENLRGEFIKPIMKGDGDNLKKELQSLSGKHRKKDIKTLSGVFGLNAEKITNDITKGLHMHDQQHIKEELRTYANSYKEYYNKIQDAKFLCAQEVFELLCDYIDTVTIQTQNKLTNILLQYPGSEVYHATINKALRPKETSSEQISEQEDTFIGRLKKIIHSDTSEETQIADIEKFFLSMFNLQRISWKRFYRELGLKDEYIPLIKKFNLQIIQLLIQIKETHDEATIATLHVSLEQAIRECTGKEITATPENNGPQGPKVVGKVQLPHDPKGDKKRDKIFGKTDVFHTDELTIEKKEIEKKQDETVNPLTALVGKTMNIPEFLAAFSLEYDEIEQYIRSRERVPARYFGPTTTRKGTLHFFTIGQEKKGNNDICINVSVINKDKTFNEGEIYELEITEMITNPKAKNDERKQTLFVKGIFKESLKAYTNSSSQKLGDNKKLQELHESQQEK